MRNYKNTLKNKVDSFIIIIIMTVSLIGVNIIFNILFNGYTESKQTALFSDKNIGISLEFKKEISKNEINEIIKKINEDKIPFAFSKQTALQGELFETIITLDHTNNPNMYDYKIKKGRNISKDDIENNRNVIVISSNYKDFFYKKDNKDFIDIDGISYEIIGITENNLANDWYNLKAITPYNFKNGLDMLDTSLINFYTSKDTQILKDISSNIEHIQYGSLTKLSIAKIIENMIPEINYYFILSMLSLINLCLFSILFIKKRQPILNVLRAVGYNKRQAGNYILKQLIICGFISSLIAWISYYPFAKYFNEKFMNIGLNPSLLILFVDILFSLLIIFIISKLLFKLLNTSEIQDGIKRKNNIFNSIWIKLFIIIELFMMFNYSIESYILNKDLNKTMNISNSIVDFDNTLVMNPFSVSFDSDVLEEYDITNTINILKNQGGNIINYLYTIDTSKDVSSMKMNEQNGYSSNFEFNFTNLEEPPVPLLYISNDSFDTLKLTGIEKQSNTGLSNEVLVYAGSNYKNSFNIGDTIKGDSGAIYKLIGFIDQGQYLFDTNSGSKIIDNFNILDNFIIVPFEMSSLDNINISGLDTDSKRFYALSNSLIKYSNKESELAITKTLNKKDLQLDSFNNQLQRMKITDFSYVKYKFFSTIMISCITFISLICYIVSLLYSEKRNMGIRRALGYSIGKIVKIYLFKIFSLLTISNFLIILYKIIKEKALLNTDTIIFIIIIDIFIIILSLLLIICCVKKEKISELIKEKE